MAESVKEEKTELEKAKELIEQDKKSRSDSFQKELDELMKKYDIKLGIQIIPQ